MPYQMSPLLLKTEANCKEAAKQERKQPNQPNNGL
jgi:hypothetical protein